MPPRGRIRTRLQGTIQRYYYMEATVRIRRGEEILGDECLAPIPVSLSDLHDENRFLVPNAPNNGLGTLQSMYKDLPARKRNKLDQLYNATPVNGLLSLVSTNAFLDEGKLQSHDFRVLRIYDKISRVNHSCHPNAAVAYDPDRNLGTLHALRDIQNGEEIFINYRVDELFTLSNVQARQQALQQTYNFTCLCSSCSLAAQPLRRDLTHRRAALARFNDISPPYPHFANDQQRNTHLCGG